LAIALEIKAMATLTAAGITITAAKRRLAQRRVETRNFITALAQLHDQSAVSLPATSFETTVDKHGQTAKRIGWNYDRGI
jgi:hypothetical protein